MNDNTKKATIDPAGRWCILRTSPGRTLALMSSLEAAGYAAWTPRQTQVRRRPRSKATIERDVAIAPTFVFVRADHLLELAAAEVAFVNPHPAFSIFRHAGRIPLVADREVEGLRAEEQRARQAHDRFRLKASRTKRRRLVMGQRVSVGDTAFAGLTGVVEEDGDRSVTVAFGPSFRMRIATWLLSPDDIEQTQPTLGAAA